MVSVPRLWPGETVAILGGGPSLTREDVEYCRGKVRTIAINQAYQLASWADVLYACDRAFWRRNPEAVQFAGLKYSLTAKPKDVPTVQVLKYRTDHGLDLDPRYLATGHNSGYQAINLALHLGATRILLLGYDMQRGPRGEQNWHRQNPKSNSPYVKFRKAFPSIVGPLHRAGVSVINCSRVSALTCFPCRPLREVLCVEVAA